MESFRDAENLVADLLRQQGWQILSQNFRGRGYELDLVANKENTLAIVEVKQRRNYGRLPIHRNELLTPRKRQSLIRGAIAFISGFQIVEMNVRIDLAVVGSKKVSYYPNIFESISSDF